MTIQQSVLIVDDEPRNQRIITETLDGVVPLQVASTGEEALKVIEKTVPSLILLDIMMPGMDGYEVCKRIRTDPKCALSKIILVSGKAMIEERLKGYDVGADDYMTKPFAPEELLAKARVFLRLAAAEQQLADINRSLEEKVQERTRQLTEAQGMLVNTAKMAALGEMAGGIAHEINTPLGTIQLVSEQLTDLISDEKLDKAAMADSVQIIIRTVQRIGAIVRGLKTFSRDGTKDALNLFPLSQIVTDATALCGEKIKYNCIKLEIDPIPDGVTAYCRPVQISQVLLNLINNSCDAIATLPEKWIRISVSAVDGSVLLTVTDSGKGISESVRAKIFQPFFTTKEIGKGTGLGLSISKGIIEAHRGSLGIDAASPNTRFVIKIPSQA